MNVKIKIVIIDAVYIATPHNTHYEYIKKALNNNKHVLCEKSITLSISKTCIIRNY